MWIQIKFFDVIFLGTLSTNNMKEIIASFPIDIEKKGGKTRIRFFPKSPTAKYPDNPVLILYLDDAEKEKLRKILE